MRFFRRDRPNLTADETCSLSIPFGPVHPGDRVPDSSVFAVIGGGTFNAEGCEEILEAVMADFEDDSLLTAMDAKVGFTPDR